MIGKMKELLEQIHHLAEVGLKRYEGTEDGELWQLATEAKRMERFIRETATGINALNEKLNLVEGRLEMWERRLVATATKAAFQNAATKPAQTGKKVIATPLWEKKLTAGRKQSKRKARKSV
jgi:hypothetical protein